MMKVKSKRSDSHGMANLIIIRRGFGNFVIEETVTKCESDATVA